MNTHSTAEDKKGGSDREKRVVCFVNIRVRLNSYNKVPALSETFANSPELFAASTRATLRTEGVRFSLRFENVFDVMRSNVLPGIEVSCV